MTQKQLTPKLAPDPKDILHQIKRAICREIYRSLTKPGITIAINNGDLRELRIAKGITQQQAAKALDTWPSRAASCHLVWLLPEY